MMQCKILDHYLTSGKVSTTSIKFVGRYRLLKTLTKNFNIKFLVHDLDLKVIEGGVRMIQHETLDQCLPRSLRGGNGAA